MKKHLLLSLSAVFLLTLASSSQVFSKKDKLFGASAGISFYNSSNVPSSNDSRGTNIGLIPSFAWAIKNNLAMGIKAGVFYTRRVYGAGTQKNSQTNWQVGPSVFIRKYKLLEKNFGVSFTHELDGYYYKEERRDVSYHSKSSNWQTGYGFVPAAFYKFSDRFIGEANFGGVYINHGQNGPNKSWSAGANFLTYLNIGVQYIIPSKKA
jgi:hypothetical protein